MPETLAPPDTLAPVLAGMERLDTLRDAERAHAEGDDLLCDALMVLAALHPEERPLIEQIVRAWEGLSKWYA